MTRQERMEILRNKSEWLLKEQKYLEELNEAYKKIKELTIKDNVSDGWIKFTDKFPEENEFVLLNVGGHAPALACYKGNNKFIDISLNDIWDISEDEIDLWFPIPSPPKQIT